jgi:hypothetical protein
MRYAAVFTALLLLGGCSADHADLQGRWMNLEGNIIVIKSEGAARVAQEGLEGGQDATWSLSGDTLRLTIGDSAGDELWNEYRLRVTPDTLYMIDIALHQGTQHEVISSDDFSYRMGRPPERMHFIRYGDKQ